VSGGSIVVVPGQLAVDLTPWKVVAIDGMVVEETSSSTRIACPAGETTVIAVYAKYIDNNAAEVSVLSFESSVFDAIIDKSYYIVMGKVEVPAAAASVLSSYINTTDRDSLDILGRSAFRGYLDSASILPAANNRVGDFYLTGGGLESQAIYAWNGSVWVNLTNTLVLTADLANHRANLFTDEKHLSDSEKYAVEGTSGVPVSLSNKLIDNADPRIPTLSEKQALAGSDGAPSSTNKYVTQAYTLALTETYTVDSGSSYILLRPLANQEGPVYLGSGGMGSANQYFCLMDNSLNREYTRTDDVIVSIEGIYDSPSMVTPIDPSVSTNVVNGYAIVDIYVKFTASVDSQCKLRYPKQRPLGTMPEDAFLRGHGSDASIPAKVIAKFEEVSGRDFDAVVPTKEQNINLRTDLTYIREYIASTLQPNYVIYDYNKFKNLPTEYQQDFPKNVGVVSNWFFNNSASNSYSYDSSLGRITYSSPLSLSGDVIGAVFIDGSNKEYLITSVVSASVYEIKTRQGTLPPLINTTLIGLSGSIKPDDNPRQILLSDLSVIDRCDRIMIREIKPVLNEYSYYDNSLAYGISQPIKSSFAGEPRVRLYGACKNEFSDRKSRVLLTGAGSISITGYFEELVLLVRRSSGSVPSCKVLIDKFVEQAYSASAVSGSANITISGMDQSGLAVGDTIYLNTSDLAMAAAFGGDLNNVNGFRTITSLAGGNVVVTAPIIATTSVSASFVISRAATLPSASLADPLENTQQRVVIAKGLNASFPHTVLIQFDNGDPLTIFGCELYNRLSVATMKQMPGRAFGGLNLFKQDAINNVAVSTLDPLRRGRVREDIIPISEGPTVAQEYTLTDFDGSTDTPGGIATIGNSTMSITSGLTKFNKYYRAGDYVRLISATAQETKQISSIGPGVGSVTFTSPVTYVAGTMILVHLGSTNNPSFDPIRETARFYMPDFGAGTEKDFTTLLTTPSDRLFTLEDGTTLVAAKNVQYSTVGVEGVDIGIKLISAKDTPTTESHFLIKAVCSRMDVLIAAGSSMQAAVDGCAPTTYSLPTQPSLSRVCVIENARYQTHEVVITSGDFSTSTPADLTIAGFILYEPRIPDEQTGNIVSASDSQKLATHNWVAAYYGSLSSFGEEIPIGGVGIDPFILGGEYLTTTEIGDTWSVSTDFSKSPAYGRYIVTSQAGASFNYLFWGTGFEVEYTAGPDQGIQQVYINDVILNNTNFPAVSFFGMNPSSGTVDMYSATVRRKKFGAYGLSAIGLRKKLSVQVQTPTRQKNASSTNFFMNISAIYELNTLGDLKYTPNKGYTENDFYVGKDSIRDERNFDPGAIAVLEKPVTRTIAATARASTIALALGSSSVTVSFSAALPTSVYALSVSMINTVDNNAFIQPILVTSRTQNGFTAKWSMPLDTANYTLSYTAILEV